jgi:hypothetical protein
MASTYPFRSISLVILAAFLGGMLGLGAQAQSIPSQSVPSPSSLNAALAAAICTQQAPQDHLPDAPGQPSDGSIHGTVTDSAGNVIVGARVTLEADASEVQRTLLTDGAGFFNFTGLDPGRFGVTITSKGFSAWVVSEIVLPPGGNCELARVALQITSVNTDVNVVFTIHDLAEEQMKAEEKQRVLGVFPNFYTSYIWHAAPLTAKQKFRLALRTSVDPTAFVITGVTAGIEQWQNYFSGYGQGSQGYAKRYGAAYADGFISTMIGAAILPSAFHQDPRYFYKGTGSIGSRALYAISTVVICRGDNGRWQPNYSNVLGNLASAGISNIYYPSTNRNGAQVTIDNALIGTAEGAISALIQEFVLRKVSRGIQPSPGLRP